VDHRVVVLELDIDSFTLEEFGEMGPVVHFFVKLETVIELVHFDFSRKEPLKDFSKDPTV
jgi:hypothetical protein